MTTLITGVTGLVGYNLYQKIPNALGISRTTTFPNTFKIDLTNLTNIRIFQNKY